MLSEDFTTLWEQSWDGENWTASWSQAVSSLTPTEALWTPAPDRHSIWQTVLHVIFWRRFTLDVLANKPKPDREWVDREHFAPPKRTDDGAWREALGELERSHLDILAAMRDPALASDRIRHHLPHDAYHLGQIMQLRAMQGMSPIL
jgi:hypothetical protein